MNVLVTGAAGFIGMHLSRRLLDDGHDVLGVDDLNSYYEPGLKQARLDQLSGYDRFRFEKIDISQGATFGECSDSFGPDVIIHLAAQAGVRYSIDHPEVYVQSNLVGFANVLEAGRRARIQHLIYASSSSVYGSRQATPFYVTDRTDEPISLYAATKKSNEVMAHSYSHLFEIPTTGLRFFTVYGPWGRPDMAYFLFTKHIVEGTPFKLFNGGELSRDFTFIDDIVESISRLLSKPPHKDGKAPNRILNIGNGHPVHVRSFVSELGGLLGKKALYDSVEMQAGDVEITFADTQELVNLTGYQPQTDIKVGLKSFVDWYNAFYTE